MTVTEQIAVLAQIILIDLSLAGDNAIVVGLAVSGLPSPQRHWATMAGITCATLMRIVFAFFAIHLLKITGMGLAGGLLLLFVVWKLFRELQQRRHQENQIETNQLPATKTLWSAIIQILIADVSMSIDNVLAVAGASHGQTFLLAIGLVISVGLMGFASVFIARHMAHNHWIGYAGLAVILYTAVQMVIEGAAVLG